MGKKEKASNIRASRSSYAGNPLPVFSFSQRNALPPCPSFSSNSLPARHSSSSSAPSVRPSSPTKTTFFPLLLTFTLLFLLLPILHSTLSIDLTGPQDPITPPAMNKTLYVHINATVRCTGPLCNLPGYHYTLTASAGTDGGTTISVRPDRSSKIDYICNSYASCRNDNLPLILVARLLDDTDSVVETSPDKPTRTLYQNAPDMPPTVNLAPDPVKNANQVRLYFNVIDKDDAPATLTYTINANENGRSSNYPEDSNWREVIRSNMNDQIYVEMAYICFSNPCSLPLGFNIIGYDPTGKVSQPKGYLFDVPAAPNPPASITCNGTLYSNSQFMDVTTVQNDNRTYVDKHEYTLTSEPGMGTTSYDSPDYNNTTGISHAKTIGFSLNGVDNLTVSVRAMHEGINSSSINCTYIINATAQPYPDTPNVTLSPDSPYNYTSVITAQANNTPGSISAHHYIWRLNHNGVYTDMEQYLSTSEISASTYNCISNGCSGGDTLTLFVYAMNGTIENGTSRKFILPITGPVVNEDPQITISPSDAPPGINVQNPISITATALQIQPSTSAVNHTYYWIYPSGSKAENRTINNKESTSTFSCTQAICGGGLSVRVNAIDADGKVIGSSAQREIHIAGLDYDLQMPILRTHPSSPPDNANFLLFALNPVHADAHVYTYTYEKTPRTVSPISVVPNTNDPNINQSNITVACTIDECRNSCIDFEVYAKKGTLRSPSAMSRICPQPPPLNYKPEVVDFQTSANGAQELKSFSTTPIVNDTQYFLTIGPPSNSHFDNYTYYTFTNGVPDAPARTATANAQGQFVLSLACSGCHPGDAVFVRVSGQDNGATSPELSLAFPVPRSNKMAEVQGICSSAWLDKWRPLMAIAWAGLFFFIVFIYMLGHAFNIPQLTEWSKTEIGQALLGVGMLLVILWLMGLQCNLKIGEMAGWAGINLGSTGPAETHITPIDTMSSAAVKGLAWSMQQTHLSITVMRYVLGVINIRATFSQSMTEVPGIGSTGFSLSPLAGDWTMMGPLQMMLNLNTTFMLSLLFQYFSLAIFSSASGLFFFLVPIGLILRCVPYLRGFGGALAAIGVGFYILYPMFLALIGIMLPPIYAPQLVILSSIPPSVDSMVGKEQSITGQNIYSYFYSMPEITDSQSSILRTTGIEDPNSCAGLGRCFYTVNLAPLFELTALNFLRAVLLPAAGLLVIVSFVRDLSAIFGEEVEASKLMQMV